MFHESRLLALRALKTVALTKSPFLDIRERELMEQVQGRMGVTADLDALEPASPEELCAGVADAEERAAVVSLLLLVAAADGQVDRDESESILDFARVLGVEHQALATLAGLQSRPFEPLRLELSLGGDLEQSYLEVERALLQRDAA